MHSSSRGGTRHAAAGLPLFCHLLAARQPPQLQCMDPDCFLPARGPFRPRHRPFRPALRWYQPAHGTFRPAAQDATGGHGQLTACLPGAAAVCGAGCKGPCPLARQPAMVVLASSCQGTSSSYVMHSHAVCCKRIAAACMLL